MPREAPRVSSMYSLRASALRCSSAAFALLNPRSRANSARVGARHANPYASEFGHRLVAVLGLRVASGVLWSVDNTSMPFYTGSGKRSPKTKNSIKAFEREDDSRLHQRPLIEVVEDGFVDLFAPVRRQTMQENHVGVCCIQHRFSYLIIREGLFTNLLFFFLSH